MPRSRIAVHHRLHGGELAARPSLDEIPRDREGTAAETDDRLEPARPDEDRIHERRLVRALEAVGEHPVPAGPLAVRWLGYELEAPQAGTLGRARVVLENAGTAPWRALHLSYHWLDDRGNPIVWDGLRHAIQAEPGDRVETELRIRGPIPPGRYRLAFDLVDEHRFWLAELGNFSPELDVEVTTRDAEAARAFLAPEADLDPEWKERVYEAHTEGYAAVGGSIDQRR